MLDSVDNIDRLLIESATFMRDAALRERNLFLDYDSTRADYEALLDDLEKNFSARTKAMLLDDRSDLNVEIEVLRERLMREGVATGDV